MDLVGVRGRFYGIVKLNKSTWAGCNNVGCVGVDVPVLAPGGKLGIKSTSWVCRHAC